MNNYKKYTLIFTGLMVVVGIAYDIWVIIAGGRENSISWTIIELSHQYPMITFSAGFLCGHLFWNMQTPNKTKE